MCYTYGEADENDYTAAAQGYFYAGWLYAVSEKDLDEAVKHTAKCLQLDSNLPEAHYHLAKFHSIRGEEHRAIQHRRKAIVDFDRNYCIKASSDPDFQAIKVSINKLFSSLRSEACFGLKTIIDPIDDLLNSSDGKYFDKQILDRLRFIKIKLSENTYFSCSDGLANMRGTFFTLKHLTDHLEVARKKEKNRRQIAINTVEQWGAFLRDHVPPNSELSNRAKKMAENARQLVLEERDEDALELSERIRLMTSGWLTNEQYEAKIKREQEIKKEEQSRRRERGLCIACGTPVSFWLKLLGSPYCSKHAYPVNAQRFHVRAFPASKWGAPHVGRPKQRHIGSRVCEFGPIVGLDARLGR